jgi:spoIIIJ-associated protein
MEPFDNNESDPKIQPFDPEVDSEFPSDPDDFFSEKDDQEEDDDEEYDDIDDEGYDDGDEESLPHDPRVDVAHEFLVKVLDEMRMDVSVHRRRPREGSSPDEIHLEIMGHDVGRVIGKKGQVLAALQYLVNRAANRPGLPLRHLVLDAEGYRYRRETALASLAKRLGEQAVKEGKIITFEPMSPRDRRVVHLALAKFPNVVTKSDGEGEDRRVRIIPVRK